MQHCLPVLPSYLQATVPDDFIFDLPTYSVADGVHTISVHHAAHLLQRPLPTVITYRPDAWVRILADTLHELAINSQKRSTAIVRKYGIKPLRKTTKKRG